MDEPKLKMSCVETGHVLQGMQGEHRCTVRMEDIRGSGRTFQLTCLFENLGFFIEVGKEYYIDIRPVEA